jgi:stage III sporulation protein SpoIIIAA
MVDPEVTRALEHIKLAALIGQKVEKIMATIADTMALIAQLQSGQTETLKDVQRLIAAGDTTAANAALQAAIDKNTEIDAAVEAASPEPTAPPADGGADGNLSTPE